MRSGPVSVHEQDRVVILRFVVHRIIDGTGLDAWSEQLKDPSMEGKHIMLDFSNVQFISSAAVNKLIVLDRAVKRSGRRLVMFGLQRSVRTIMTITRMDEVFTIVADEPSAWSELGEKPPSQ